MKKLLTILFTAVTAFALTLSAGCVADMSKIPEGERISYKGYSYGGISIYKKCEHITEYEVIAIRDYETLQAIIEEESGLITGHAVDIEIDPDEYEFIRQLKSYEEDYFETSMLLLLHYGHPVVTHQGGKIRAIVLGEDGTLTVCVFVASDMGNKAFMAITEFLFLAECKAIEYTSATYVRL